MTMNDDEPSLAHSLDTSFQPNKVKTILRNVLIQLVLFSLYQRR
jgi:hypothetical protein